MSNLRASLQLAVLVLVFNSLALGQTEKLSSIPKDSLAIVSVDVSAIRQSKEFELLPWEVLSVLSREELGVDLLLANSVEVSIGLPSPLPIFGAAIRTAKPVDIRDLTIPGMGEIQQLPKNPKVRFRQVPGDVPLRVAQQDDSTVYFGSDGLLNRMMSGPTGTAKILEVAKESKDPVVVAISIETLRPLIVGFLKQGKDSLPPELISSLTTILQETKVIRISSTVGLLSTINLDLYGGSPESAKTIEQALVKLRDFGIEFMDAQVQDAIQRSPKELSPEMQQAILAYKERLTTAAKKSIWTIQDDRLHVEIQSANSTATIGILTGLLLPAVQAARDAARRASSVNNLKQIVIAMHQYHDHHSEMPPRVIKRASDDEPLLSWRVALLPYLEQEELYNQFHLDEPWDSPHNEALIAKMPAIFANPSRRLPRGKTVYIRPQGEGLPGSLDKVGFRNITDGTSNTIAILEVDEQHAVNWTEPTDFDFDEAEELISEIFPTQQSGANAAFYDGSIRFLSSEIDPAVLKALMTHGGGEVVN